MQNLFHSLELSLSKNLQNQQLLIRREKKRRDERIQVMNKSKHTKRSHFSFRTSLALKPNRSFMELEEEKENFSRAMTNIITTDLEVLEPEDVRAFKFCFFHK